MADATTPIRSGQSPDGWVITDPRTGATITIFDDDPWTGPDRWSLALDYLLPLALVIGPFALFFWGLGGCTHG